MAERLRRNLPALKVLKQAKPKLRKAILSAADKDLFQCICECCLNICKGSVSLTPGQKAQLCKHSKTIRQLADRKVSLKKKKQLLQQRGGAAFLPALIAPIVSIAAGLISDLLSNK